MDIPPNHPDGKFMYSFVDAELFFSSSLYVHILMRAIVFIVILNKSSYSCKYRLTQVTVMSKFSTFLRFIHRI